MEAFNHRIHLGSKALKCSRQSRHFGFTVASVSQFSQRSRVTGVGAQSVPGDCVHWRKDLIRAAQCAWCGSCSLPPLLLQEEGPNRFQHHLSVSPSNYTNRLRHIRNTDWTITPRRPILRLPRGLSSLNWGNAVLIEYKTGFVCFWQH